LFTVGSSLACDPEKEPLMKIPDLNESDIVALENEIDRMSRSLNSHETLYPTGGPPRCIYNSCCTLRMQACRKDLCKYAGARIICRPAGDQICQSFKRFSFCAEQVYRAFTEFGRNSVETPDQEVNSRMSY
jgi:hypothetical protein